MDQELNLTTVSDDRLLQGLFEILKKTRHDEADLIAHIAEVDARRLYAREAASSMFSYCTERLHLSEPEAALRIRVARVSRKHPVVLRMLRDGRLHLSGIALLAPLLTVENRKALLKRAVHKSKREIEELIAELRPIPDARTMVRKLPVRHEGVLGSAPHVLQSTGSTGQGTGSNPHDVALLSRDGRADTIVPATSHQGTLSSPVQRPDAVVPVTPHQLTPSGPQQRPDAVSGAESSRDAHPVRGRSACARQPARSATVVPLAPARYRVQFTASADLRGKLERLQALMRSSVPDGDLAKIIDLAVTEKLERLEARRFAKTKKPRKRLAQTDTRPKSRHIPAAVRRFVERRDGGRCTYKDTHGRRCTKRHDLEFHHRKPFGRGGDHSPEGLALMCRTHNALLAEQDFGKEKMAPYRRRAGRVSGLVAVPADQPPGRVDRATQGGDSRGGPSTHAPPG
jgi:hypothetical protein